ncbi:YbfB/YjiJ family MFS transporter [Mycolicibacterium goodii]|uniref:YbfB/YjiJ family MFS transporter n=1 Tax=Mycolicibacterium goodii TaxID=134601 RepID=UPI000A9A2AB5
MQHHAHVARTAAALAAAMGIGRFVYTPILPLMTAQAGMSAHAAADLATANYVGYLVGAVAGSIWPRLARSPLACRVSLLVLVASLAVMPLATTTIEWMTLRAIAGAVSALVFVIAVNTMLEHLHSHPAHLAGWGFGGVGAGIALSAVLVLAVSDWKAAWWASAAVAAVLCALAWGIRPAPPARRRRSTTTNVHRTGPSRCCSSATRWKASATSSRAPSWWRRSVRTHRGGWAAAPGWWSAWPPCRPRRCGRR